MFNFFSWKYTDQVMHVLIMRIKSFTRKKYGLRNTQRDKNLRAQQQFTAIDGIGLCEKFKSLPYM